MHNRFKFGWLLAVLLCGVFAMQLSAQTVVTGDVVGTVTDPSNAVVPGATVTLSNVDTGSTSEVKTTSTGLYRFPLLKPGNYRVSVTQSGFRTTQQSVTVAVGQVTTSNIQLQVGQQSETVEVTGATPVIQTENANISTSFTPAQIDLLPNGGNDLTAVAQTAPGVVMNNAGGYGNFSTFGLPATANLFTVNGNDEMDPYLNLNNSGATNLLLGKNEVQETAVVSNGYTGQYGRNAGAQVDYATKSGTNAFHGNALYWYNTAGFNANDWFNNNTNTPIPEAINNQWAASIGGPIKKDKVFFFVDTEGLRFILSSSAQTLIPTAAYASAVENSLVENSTIWGGLPITATNSVPFYTNFYNQFRNPVTRGVATLPVDSTIDTTGNLGCGDLNVGGNLFPALAPFGGTGFNPAFGVDNAGGGQPCAEYFRSTSSQGANEWTLASRVDINVGNSDRLFFRFKTDHGVQPTFTDAINPAIFNATSNQPQYEGQVNWTHTLTANVLNSFIASGSWYSASFINPTQGAADAAFPGTFLDLDASSWGAAGTNTLGGTGYAFPQGRNVTQYQFTDDLSVAKGNHNLKMGVNFRRNDISDYTFGTFANPLFYSFSQSELDAGYIYRVRKRFPQTTSVPTAIYSLGLYFQDEFRVNSSLKLTLTLRADRNSNLTCGVNCFSYPSTPLPLGGSDPTQPFSSVFSTNQNTTFRNLEKVVFQPRVGFAWSPKGSTSTVLRGGVGLFSDLYPGTLADNFIRNPPFSPRFDITGGFAGVPFAPTETDSLLSQTNACGALFQSTFANGGSPNSLATDPTRASTCTPPTINDQANTIRNPKYLQWNLELQQALGNKTSFSVNYVGNHGYDEFITNPWANSYSLPDFGPSGTATFGGLPAANTSNPVFATCTGCNFLRAPSPFAGNTLFLYNGGVSNYHGLVTSVTRRFTYGFTGNFNYTWSHAQDEVSNGGFLPFSGSDSLLNQLNPYCLRCLNYGNADYDVRHNITANYVWDLPFKANGSFLNRLISSWTLSGTFFYHTGYPFSVTDAVGSSNPGGLYNVSSATFLATYTGGPVYACNSPYNACINSSEFLPATTESNFGNVPRNAFRGPGYFNSDFTILKNIPITERFRIGVGATAYNVFNHPNFGNPSSDISSGDFGTIVNTVAQPTNPYGAFNQSAVSGRVLQLHARLSF